MFLKHLFFLAAIGVAGASAQTPAPKLARVCLVEKLGYPLKNMDLTPANPGVDKVFVTTGKDGCVSFDATTLPRKTMWVVGGTAWLDRKFTVPANGVTRKVLVRHNPLVKDLYSMGRIDLWLKSDNTMQ